MPRGGSCCSLFLTWAKTNHRGKLKKRAKGPHGRKVWIAAMRLVFMTAKLVGESRRTGNKKKPWNNSFHFFPTRIVWSLTSRIAWEDWNGESSVINWDCASRLWLKRGRVLFSWFLAQSLRTWTTKSRCKRRIAFRVVKFFSTLLWKQDSRRVEVSRLRLACRKTYMQWCDWRHSLDVRRIAPQKNV